MNLKVRPWMILFVIVIAVSHGRDTKSWKKSHPKTKAPGYLRFDTQLEELKLKEYFKKRNTQNADAVNESKKVFPLKFSNSSGSNDTTESLGLAESFKDAEIVPLPNGATMSPDAKFGRAARDELSAEHKLFEYLFSGYNKHVRPVDKSHGPTHVVFEVSLFNILEMNTRDREMTINTEMIMKWLDYHLQWDPEDYEGVAVIRVPYYDIWYPDIILYNTAMADYNSAILNTYAIIKYSGKVELVSHALLVSICSVDVQYYPFDQQICQLTFASWTYDRKAMVLDGATTRIGHYIPNPEFFLENFWTSLTDEFNECCPEPFSTIKYYIQIQRRTKFAMFFYIMPGILINICAVMVFSLPAETGEKVGLGINSMIAMIVFLMAMTEKIPPTSNLPIAGIYYGVCLAVITINIAFSVFVLNINFRGIRGLDVPIWVKKSAAMVAKILAIQIPEVITDEWDLDEDDSDSEEDEKVDPGLHRVHPIEPAVNFKENIKKAFELNANIPDEKQEVFSIETAPLKDPFQRRSIRALEGMLKVMVKRDTAMEKDKKSFIKQEEWKFVSRVMDRFFFIAFFLVALIFNIVILTGSPFEESFEYCPFGLNHSKCEGLDEEGRRGLIYDLSHGAGHDAGGHGGEHDAGGDGGGHGDSSGGGGHVDHGGGHGDNNNQKDLGTAGHGGAHDSGGSHNSPKKSSGGSTFDDIHGV